MFSGFECVVVILPLICRTFWFDCDELLISVSGIKRLNAQLWFPNAVCAD